MFELGRGGMGSVHLAWKEAIADFERLVVLKRMNPEVAVRPDLVRRFLDEARTASHVHHANVAGVQGVERDADGYFLVLDYIEGASLESLHALATARAERLPLPVLLRMALDGLAGLHAVHEARDRRGEPLGILHRDISTCNLLVGVDGITRVSDFGVAKSAESSSRTGARLVGKALYMAPEYLAGKPADRRIDLYAMGLVLWMSLAQNAPWNADSPAELMRHAMSDGVPRLPVGSAPKEIAYVVAKACAMRPEDRFQNALEASRALLRAAALSCTPIADASDVGALVQHLAENDLAARRASIAAARRSARGQAARPVASERTEAPTLSADAPPSSPAARLPVESAPEPPSVPAASMTVPAASVARWKSRADASAPRPPSRIAMAFTLGTFAACAFGAAVALTLQARRPVASNEATVVSSRASASAATLAAPPGDSAAPATTTSAAPTASSSTSRPPIATPHPDTSRGSSPKTLGVSVVTTNPYR